MPTKNSPIQPWIRIWFEPRPILHYWLKRRWRPLIFWLAMATGLLYAFNGLGHAWEKFPEKRILTQFWVICFIAILGAIYGICALYLSAWLYKVTGQWIGGRGNFDRVRCAIGLSCYPLIISCLIAILDQSLSGYLFVHLFLSLLSVISIVWSILLFLHLVGEAHQFSAWRTLLASILTLFLYIVFFMLLVLIITPITMLFSS